LENDRKNLEYKILLLAKTKLASFHIASFTRVKCSLFFCQGGKGVRDLDYRILMEFRAQQLGVSFYRKSVYQSI
jgi:hypothetical protein